MTRSAFLAIRRFAFPCALLSTLLLTSAAWAGSHPLVLMTDFGTKDAAAGILRGIACSVGPDLKIFDLTHHISVSNVFEGAMVLRQVAPYWPAGTVFLCLVDTGISADKKPIALKTRNGQIFVGPDNGLFGFVGVDLGIAAVRVLDPSRIGVPKGVDADDFAQRDMFALGAARLAVGTLNYDALGSTGNTVVTLADQEPKIQSGAAVGFVTMIDTSRGNVQTNLDRATLAKAYIKIGDTVKVTIKNNGARVFSESMQLVNSFTKVGPGENLLYFNNFLRATIACYGGNFAQKYKIQTGTAWTIEIGK